MATVNITGLVLYTDRITADSGSPRIIRPSSRSGGVLAAAFPLQVRRVLDLIPVNVGTISGATQVPPAYEGGIGSVQVTGTIDTALLFLALGQGPVDQLNNGQAMDVSAAVADQVTNTVDGVLESSGPWRLSGVMLQSASPWPGCNIRKAT